MARSYSSSSGLAHPLLIGAMALIAMATFFGDDGAWPPQLGGTGPVNWPEAGAGALAPENPIQTALKAPQRSLGTSGFTVQPSHRLTMTTLVLSTKTYRFGRESAVSPVDLLLGWGPMSDPEIIQKLKYRQARRFGYVRADGGQTVDLDALGPFWTNAHMIPSSPEIAEALEAVRPGQVLQLDGVLVNVTGDGNWQWRTSTTRTDKGSGACEILLITSMQVLPAP